MSNKKKTGACCGLSRVAAPYWLEVFPVFDAVRVGSDVRVRQTARAARNRKGKR